MNDMGSALQDLGEQAITHITRVETLLRSLGNAMANHHTLMQIYSNNLPEGYLVGCLELLQEEARLEEQLLEALLVTNQDFRILLVILRRNRGQT